MLKSLFACVLLGALASSATTASAGESGADILSAETLELSIDTRVYAVDGEKSWLDGGFGKLRYGGKDTRNSSDLRARPDFAEANLVWKPRFSWAISGTVVGTVQHKDKLEVGLSEAFLSFKPLSGGKAKFSARAGLMWPTISLEHAGGDWTVTETITPSAINSWIGEEVKVVGLEGSIKTQSGGTKLEATAGIFDVNDTAGTLLSFRGWALHDAKAVAFRKQPLPPLNDFISRIQPRFSTPVIALDHDGKRGLGKRPGYYAKLALEPATLPVRLEAFRYDNNGNPVVYNMDLEWGWRTRFNSLGLVADLGERTQLRAQGISGNTRMGIRQQGVHWVDTDFRSAFALISQRFGWGSVTGRAEAFGTRNHGSTQLSDDDEDGWALTVAAKRTIGAHATGLLEVVHVQSERDARLRNGLSPRQGQTQMQVALRFHW